MWKYKIKLILFCSLNLVIIETLFDNSIWSFQAPILKFYFLISKFMSFFSITTLTTHLFWQGKSLNCFSIHLLISQFPFHTIHSHLPFALYAHFANFSYSIFVLSMKQFHPLIFFPFRNHQDWYCYWLGFLLS